jgi:hypothetical protein
MKEDLQLRLTRGYVGTWKHLDKHLYLGTVHTQASTTVEPDEEAYDVCEAQQHINFVHVTTDEPQPIKRIEQALYDHFTAWGCSHDYDCCGCRSYSTHSVEYLNNGYWRVVVHSSRNY